MYNTIFRFIRQMVVGRLVIVCGEIFKNHNIAASIAVSEG